MENLKQKRGNFETDSRGSILITSKVLLGPNPTGSLSCPGHLEHLLVCVEKIVCAHVVVLLTIDYMHT